MIRRRKPLKRTGIKRKKKLGRKSAADLEKLDNQPNAKYWQNKGDDELRRIFRNKPCLVCGKTPCDHHHLIPKCRTNVHRLTLENIIPLCRNCHKMSNTMAAHSDSVMAVRRFCNFLMDSHPDRWAWMQEHEWDSRTNGVFPSFKERYEFLKTIE